jgi:uncharacterized protein YceK
MNRLLAALALSTVLTGCSTVMNSRYTDVTVTSATPGTSYTVTDEDGQRVHTGTTPEHVTLDAAAGFFDGQTYQVAYGTGETVELDSHTTGWYWLGFCVSVVSGLMVDPATGDMWTLPGEVSNVR